MNDQKTSGLERFALMASAIAGRPLSVAPLEPGVPSWTDGTTVFIDPAGEAREQIRALAVQASLLSAGSLGAEYVEALIRRPALTQRYLTVEGHRALAAHEALLPVAARLLIDPQLAARTGSPGASLTLALSRHFVADPPTRSAPSGPGDSGPKPTSSGTRRCPLRMCLDRAVSCCRSSTTTRTTAGPSSTPFRARVGGGGGIGRLIKRLLGDARSSDSGPPGADAATHWSRQGRGPSGAATMTTSVASVEDVAGDIIRREWTYPEWDVRRHRYRPDWCTVSEAESAPAQLAPFDLRTPTHCAGPWRGWAGSGSDAPVSCRESTSTSTPPSGACVDAAAGSSPSEEVYIDLLRRQRDLAVLVLLDISGSAGEPSAPAGPCTSTSGPPPLPGRRAA